MGVSVSDYEWRVPEGFLEASEADKMVYFARVFESIGHNIQQIRDNQDLVIYKQISERAVPKEDFKEYKVFQTKEHEETRRTIETVKESLEKDISAINTALERVESFTNLANNIWRVGVVLVSIIVGGVTVWKNLH